MESNLRHGLIELICKDSNLKKVCYKINPRYADDVFQEVCEEILTIPEDRLPDPSYLGQWFYRVAFNIGHNGRCRLGKAIGNDLLLERGEMIQISNNVSNEVSDVKLRDVENFMLGLNEFENRVVLLYKELGNMKQVQKITGVSYSALRKVKDKLTKMK